MLPSARFIVEFGYVYTSAAACVSVRWLGEGKTTENYGLILNSKCTVLLWSLATFTLVLLLVFQSAG